jgi:PAS domain S-box-containing protein
MSDPRPANPHGEQTTSSSWNESIWARYALAVASVAIATLLLFALYAVFKLERGSTPFIFYFGAVILSARFGGRWPGRLTVLLSAVTANHFFLPPFDSYSFEFHSILQVSVFVLVSLFIVSLTDRSRRAERAARKSRESLETTLKSIGDAVISTDAEGRIEFMNAVAERLTGWPGDEARGRSLAEVFRIVNEQTRELVESPVEKVLRAGEPIGLANHTVLIARDGTETPIDDSGAPIKNERGSTTGIVLVFHDISERRKAESALRQRERELTDFIENATVGLHWVGADGTILWANRAELEMLGYEAEEYIGHNITEFHADSEVIEDILTRLVGKNELHNYEARLRHKDGSIRYGLISSNVLWNESGEFIHTRCFTRDITDRKQAEERLRESEERLSAIAETASDAIITIDETSAILFANSAAGKIFGYTKQEMIGQHLTMLMPDYLRRTHLHALDRYIETGHRHITWDGVELPGLHRDGHEFSLEVSFAEFMLGGKRYFTGIMRDITDRKRAEVETARLAAIVESSDDTIIGKTLDGVITSWNDAAERMYGYTAEEATGQHISLLTPEERSEELTEIISKIKHGERVTHLETVRVHKDGTRLDVSLTISPIHDGAGHPIGASTIARNITEQKRAEGRLAFLAEAGNALSSSLDYETTLERFAHLAVESLADYCLIDIVTDDGAVRRVTTAHRDPALDALTGELRRFPPDLSKLEGIPKVLRTGKSEVVPRLTEEDFAAFTQGEEHRRLLGRLGLKSFITVPLAARGRVVGALTLAATGAERDYAPADVAFAEELARRAALAIENARLYSRAQETGRAKDEFLATLSHELRTPLTPIIGWTHMIRSGRLGTQEVGQGLDVIEKNAQTLSRLINDLLDMSSILSGKMRIERAPVALDAVVREAIETVRPRADARRVTLEINTTDERARARVNGDRTRLKQVFWNLLDNAVKFSPDGGRVRVRLEVEGGEARVIVEDEGAGVAREFMPHVFERFRQADMGTTRQHGGLGIGLALVKSFVEAHGGRVEVESAGEGRGTRFTVSFPALRNADDGLRNEEGAPGDAADGKSAIRNPPFAIPMRRVLLIEDAPDTLEMLRVVLERQGYSATTCEDAEAALSIAEAERFDIIISDIGLPRIDGYELIQRLRRLPHLRGVPALALTGYASTNDAQAALDAGFDAHIAKPVDPSALAEQMKHLLRQKPQGD